jgi:hypothetical protein
MTDSDQVVEQSDWTVSLCCIGAREAAHKSLVVSSDLHEETLVSNSYNKGSRSVEPFWSLLHRNLNSPASQRDIAAQRFLELLIELRAVLLQDVALLQRTDRYHDHPIIYHAIFDGPEWEEFAQAVAEMCSAPEQPPEFVNFPPEVGKEERSLQRLY